MNLSTYEIVALVTLFLSVLFPITVLSWVLYGWMCELLGGPSNSVLYDIVHTTLFDYFYNHNSTCISAGNVLNGCITEKDVNDRAEAIKELRKSIKTVKSFRARHYHRSWLNFYERDLKSAKKALKVVDTTLNIYCMKQK